MKKILILLLTTFQISFSQEINRKNYLKLENKIWEEYEINTSKIDEFQKLHPEKKDSLYSESNKLLKSTCKKYVSHIAAFLSIPIAVEALYRLRLEVPKDTLNEYFSKIPIELQKSEYGKAIKLHLNSKTMEKGTHFVDFDAYTIDGESFKLSSLKGNYIYLYFWGAGCLPCRMENKAINEHYHEIPDDLKIVGFSLDKNEKDWKKASETDHIHWYNISDKMGRIGDVKTQYQVQAIPTAFLIDKTGKIIQRFTGFPSNPNKKFIENLKIIIEKSKG